VNPAGTAPVGFTKKGGQLRIRRKITSFGTVPGARVANPTFTLLAF
jgi:hypothetical protein